MQSAALLPPDTVPAQGRHILQENHGSVSDIRIILVRFMMIAIVHSDLRIFFYLMMNSQVKWSSTFRVLLVLECVRLLISPPVFLQGSFYPYYAADRRYFHYDPTWYYYPRYRPFPLYHLNYPYWPWTIGGGRSGVSRYFYVRQPVYYSGSRLANALITGKSKPLCILPLPPSCQDINKLYMILRTLNFVVQG